MNKTIIKEIKSIYSGKLKTTVTNTMQPEIKTIKDINAKNSTPSQKTFFTGVIEKLNIPISKENKPEA